MASERVNPIVLKVSDDEIYTLEFTRDSVVFTNRQGFKASGFNDNPEEMVPILFYGAFRAHHKNVAREKTDKILDMLGGLTDKELARLIELYSAPRNALIREEPEEETEKNARRAMFQL